MAISLALTTCDGRQLALNNIRAILFDLDGTLVDTLDLHIISFQWILSELGKQVPSAELAVLMGLTPQDIIKQYFPNLSDDEIWESAIKKEEFLYRSVSNFKINEGTLELLQDLGDFGVQRIVISSTHRSLVNRLLSSVGLIDYLDDMVCGDEITHGKPNPEPFLKGLAKSGTQKEHAIGIGDSIYDGLSLGAAGIKFIGVTTGKTNCKKLLDFNFDYVINSFNDLGITGSTY
ncbi:MAG: HAD family hydrolase [Candidatus Kariarchaeaceae archaeon]